MQAQNQNQTSLMTTFTGVLPVVKRVSGRAFEIYAVMLNGQLQGTMWSKEMAETRLAQLIRGK